MGWPAAVTALGLALATGVTAPTSASVLPAPLSVAVHARSEADRMGVDAPRYEIAGNTVSGTDSPDGAPELSPGVYRESFGKGASSDSADNGTVKYYALPSLKDGERAHFTAVLATPGLVRQDDPESAGLEVQLVNAEGDRCSWTESDSLMNGTGGGHPIVSATSERRDAESTYGCFADGNDVVYARVQRTGSAFQSITLPVELHVAVAPAPEADEPVPAEEDGASGARTGGEDDPAEPIEGGLGISTARTLASGQTYSLELEPYETRYFRVPVEFGQRMSYRLSQQDNQGSSVKEVRSQVYNPILQEAELQGSSSLDLRLTSSEPDSEVDQALVAMVAQDSRDDPGNTLGVAGDYYLVLSGSEAPYDATNTDDPFRLELTAEVTGTPGGVSAWVPDISHEPRPEEPDSLDAWIQSLQDGFGGSWGTAARLSLGGVLGVLGAGSVVAGVVLLARRRRPASARPQ